MDLPYPVLLLLKATFHNYFLHPSWTSSRWVCLCMNEYWCSLVKCSYKKKKNSVGNDLVEYFCLSPSSREGCPDGQIPAMLQIPKYLESSRTLWSIWSLSRAPAPREFSATKDTNLPIMTLLQTSPSLSPDEPAGEVRVSIAGLWEMQNTWSERHRDPGAAWSHVQSPTPGFWR